jgi:hypothetical protein
MLTLTEYGNRVVNDPVRKATIELYPEFSQVLNILPFQDIAGNALTRNLEDESNPTGAATRAINADYVESTGQVVPVSRTLIMMGGSAKIDRYMITTQAGNEEDLMAEEIRKKVKATTRLFDRLFVKGNTGTTATEFDGLEHTVTSGQTISAGGDVATPSTGELTLTMVDDLVDAIQGSPSALICNKVMRRKINNLMRAAGQATETVADNFGRLIPYYAGIPIVVPEVDEAYNDILAFDETDKDGDADACTSIYAVRLGEDGLHGIQSTPPIVDQQGWIGNFKQTVVDWFVNIMAVNPRAIARLKDIHNV